MGVRIGGGDETGDNGVVGDTRFPLDDAVLVCDIREETKNILVIMI